MIFSSSGPGPSFHCTNHPDWYSSAVAMAAGSLCLMALARIFSISAKTDCVTLAWLA